MSSYDIFMETDRLVLRKFTADDASLLYELDSDPEVMRYISKGQPTPLERLKQDVLPRILQYYNEYEHLGVWAAHEKASEAFLGWFHLRPDRYCEQDAELGYRLKRFAWGKGYATEGSRALITQAFTTWGIEHIVATTLVGNTASRRVMEKCGMVCEQLFIYEASLRPGWTVAERAAVKYGVWKS